MDSARSHQCPGVTWIAVELLFAAAVIYLPVAHTLLGTAALPAWVLALLVPMPVLVWGTDEVFRAWRRAHRLY